MMRFVFSLAAITTVLAFLTASPLAISGEAQETAAEHPVLVELFTSQGCSSCPPAEAVLANLAGRPSVIALAWHVDYWDGLGWKDPYSLPIATARQKTYRAQFARESIYTPQVVIDGADEIAGFNARGIDGLIAKAAKRPQAGPTLTLEASDRLVVGTAGGNGQVWLIGYDERHETPVGRGENAGRTLVEVRAVREAVLLGSWSGAAKAFDLPSIKGEGRVILIQAEGPHGLKAARDFGPQARS